MLYTKNFLDALAYVQKNIPIVKRKSEGYGYTYADLPTVWDAIKEFVRDGGFVVRHEITPDGVRTIATHKDGDELSSFVPFSSSELKPQDVGSEITYYKRYNLCAIFNVMIEGEDDDASSANKATKVTTGEIAENCPKCGKKMKISRAGKAYCAGKYDGSCPPQELPPHLKSFSESLDKQDQK